MYVGANLRTFGGNNQAPEKESERENDVRSASTGDFKP